MLVEWAAATILFHCCHSSTWIRLAQLLRTNQLVAVRKVGDGGIEVVDDGMRFAQVCCLSDPSVRSLCQATWSAYEILISNVFLRLLAYQCVHSCAPS